MNINLHQNKYTVIRIRVVLLDPLEKWEWKNKGFFSNEFPFRAATLRLYKCTCWIKVMIHLGKRHNNYILIYSNVG